MTTGVNSWKTLSDLSKTLKSKQDNNGNENWNSKDRTSISWESNNTCDIGNVDNDRNNNYVVRDEKKLVGILKKRGSDDKTEITDVDDGFDEGLGDLDDVFDDFEEEYQSAVNNNERVNINDLDELDRNSGPDIVLDSTDTFKSHCDSLSLWNNDRTRENDNLDDNRISKQCNIIDNKQTMRPSWLELCNNNRKQNNNEEIISPNTKAKSVHFAIFPYVKEVPRVSDLEMEFDSGSHHDNNNDSEDIDGNCSFLSFLCYN